MANDVLVPDLMSPEGMDVIEAYLQCGSDVPAAARSIGMSEIAFRDIMNRSEVKNYLNDIFMESGFRNRDRLFGVLDEVIKRKLEELEETGMGSDQDIMDILWKAHKMKMEEMKMMVELEKAKAAVRAPANQTNIQNNIIAGAGDQNYMDLITSLATGGKK
ncbi:putative terminase small subunit [Salmonella phage GEC_vB_N3]|uniref:Putative terminase small subunit n=2 Tax=Epseptimavirus TaxID=2732017 RepID=A0A7S9SSI9_9CAUD|nr:putative terminase small subunit [Salmonella phage GEC_vB_N3]QPI15628.1 putative terminase small subunit [Salmonella phage GEC_vB_N7]